MSGILDALMQQVDGNTVSQLSSRLGADQAQTQKAVAAALPVLLGGLAKNASTPDGAASLASALERDHDGSVLDNVGGLLGALTGGGGRSGLGGLLKNVGSVMGGGGSPAAIPSAKAIDGAGILRHVLGGRQPVVEQGVGKASGLDPKVVSKLLPMLAPVVMGMLGKMKRERKLDAGGLANMLGEERASVQQRDPGVVGGLFGLLDKDDDGQIMDDLAKLGGGALLKNIFGK